MMKLLACLFASALMLPASVLAVDGVLCRLAVYQQEGATGENILIVDDTAEFVVDITSAGFLGPISTEIRFTELDTLQVKFNVHVVTLGPAVNTYSRSFTAEYSLPATMRDIAGKNGAIYSLVVAPLSLLAIDTAGCLADHREQGSFTSAPSAYMDLNYMTSTLADFHWESIRDYLDFSYRRFQDFAGFTLPGKMQVYLCPCMIPSVIWDRRFGMAVDPTRNTAFAVYARELNTADPFIVTHTTLLRNFGYTAPFLSEGLANYFSLAAYDMKRILADRPSLSWRDFLNTGAYLEADPTTADRVATTAVQYLVAAHGLDRFMTLYRAADDLNLGARLEEVYGTPLAELEAGWKEYVDTLSITGSQYSAQAGLAEQMMNYRLMLTYAQEYVNWAPTKPDSMRALDLLKRAHFFNGNYYDAAAIQEALIAVGDTGARSWMARGSYEMMNGRYAEALKHFEQARGLDTTDEMVHFNLALYYINQGDPATARDILLNNISFAKEARAQGETRIFLANILADSEAEEDRKTAERLYQEVINIYQQTLSIRRSSPTHYLWMGIAYLGLGEIETGIDHLKVADFLESRPFYQGMINLWLGKGHLRSGHKEAAGEYFARVLAISSADYHQREARAYLEQP
ncbi:MAG: hypothetical protein JSW34_05700 [Candidatus Zixiibacteriota bacterium]|nr:MAG: hypothetical protein JSW34_05700 [candidate division Zixibacteria bacterium]